MKNSISLFIILSIGWAACGQAPLLQPAQNLDAAQKSAPFIEVERGENHRVWARPHSHTNHFGKVVARTDSYTELGTGMHYKDGQGRWQQTKAEIEITQDGSAVTTGPHKVTFTPNINTVGAVTLTTPDAKKLRSRILGLSYFDSSTGQAVLIAETKDSIGELAPPNQIFYRDAFDNIHADVQYIYRNAGFEQNIILRAQPPSPAECGLNPKTTCLQVLTEFFDSPTPSKEIISNNSTNFADEVVDFGQMKIVRGRAFSVGKEARRNESVPVSKQWTAVDSRTFLVEEVPFRNVDKELKVLGKSKLLAAITPKYKGQGENVIAALRSSLPKKMADSKINNATNSVRLAALDRQLEPGFVLDYQIMSGATNFTFESGKTYLVSSLVHLYGTTVIEGGAVVKFLDTTNNWGWIVINGPLICKTGPYNMAVFTSSNDDSVGEEIPGSTSQPTTNPYFMIEAQGPGTPGTAWELSYVRMSYGLAGLVAYDGRDVIARNCQFVNNTYGLGNASFINDEWVGSVIAENTLFAGCQVPFYVGDRVSGVNVTVNGFTNLCLSYDGFEGLAFTNSLLIGNGSWALAETGNTNLPSPVLSHTAVFGTDTGLFASAGAGNHYLTSNSTNRNAGSTSISAALLSDMQKKTTHPPIAYSNTTVSTSLTLLPSAQRDTDAPDIGYHYDPIDYLVFNYGVSNALLTISNGAVVGFGDMSGIWLADGAEIRCVGTPLIPNRFAEYRTVQEQPKKLGVWGVGGGVPVSSYRVGGVGSPGLFRFTHFHRIGMGGYTIYTSEGVWAYSRLTISDCFFSGGQYQMFGGVTEGLTINNNIFDGAGSFFWLMWSDVTNFPVTLRNNLFRKQAVEFDNFSGTDSTSGAAAWLVKDNVFDNSEVYDSSDPAQIHSHNAYINTSSTSRLVPTNVNDVVLSSFTYTDGPLGKFYQFSTNLLNAGSTNASTMGLYHYTTTTNQLKETNSIVDIGYHYVALNSSGNPTDSDADGTPDYLEDSNGDGIMNAGEPPWGISILAQPTNRTVYVGDSSTFTVSAAGVAPLFYQWRFNGVNIAGATSASYALSLVQTNNAGTYSVVVSNVTGSITSATATLTVQIPTYTVLFGARTNYTFQGDMTYYVAGGLSLYGTTTIEGGAVIKYAVSASLNIIPGPPGVGSPKLDWQAEAYRPVIFTAKDDNSVGETISGSTGSPTNYYGNPMLLLASVSPPSTLTSFRMAFAKTGLQFGGASANLFGGQFINCQNGLVLGGGSVLLGNALFINTKTNFIFQGGATVTAQNTTFNQSAYLAAAPSSQAACQLALTNCVLADVVSLLAGILQSTNGNYNAFFNSPAFGAGQFTIGSYPFQTVGAGSYYLATNSTIRNVGTTNIDSTLLAALRKKTTYSPFVRSNLTVTANTTLLPAVQRDTDALDLGYHYDPVDYLVHAYGFTNCTLTISPGTAIGYYDYAGLWMQDGALLICEGTPLLLNRFVDYRTVQEQPVKIGAYGGASSGMPVTTYRFSGVGSPARFRFTEFSRMAASTYGNYNLYLGSGNWAFSDLTVQDCRFTGGNFNFWPDNNLNVTFHNNLCDRTIFYAMYYDLTSINFSVRNNLFRGGAVYFDIYNTPSAIVKDNAFDSALIEDWSDPSLNHSHNAYIKTIGRLQPPNGNDVVLTNFNYTTGLLGKYYHGSTNLLNQGSVSAVAGGLYYYATTTNQVKETNSTVDMGLHYIALNANGQPVDTDSDGLPDYYEDRNGNGSWQAGEASITNVDTDYDGRSDYQEYQEGTDSTNPSSAANALLGRWTFDNTNSWVGDQGQLPIGSLNIHGQLSPRTNSVFIYNTNGAYIKYRDVETSGHANFNCQRGTLRYWFKPDWSSTSAGGNGPQAFGTMVSIAVNSTNGFWGVTVAPDGNSLYLNSWGPNGSDPVHCQPTISWTSNTWHQVVVTYSGVTSKIYVDGQLAATGSGITNYPDAIQRAIGLTLGQPSGGNQCRGAFEDLETFNYELNAASVSSNYQGSPLLDIDGDGLLDNWEMQYFGNLNEESGGDYDYDGRNQDQEFADGTDPINPNSANSVRLAYWRFNDPLTWIGEAGQLPIATNGVLATSSWSGIAAEFSAGSATNLSYLAYKDLEAGGDANINARSGTLRFWFRPKWQTTSSTNASYWQFPLTGMHGGAGNAGTYWGLFALGDGTKLSLLDSISGTNRTNVQASINWQSNSWHQVVITYSTQATAIYLDGKLAGSGSGVVAYPGFNIRTNGLGIGGLPAVTSLANPSATPFLLNVDFGAGNGPSAKTGAAAIGLGTNDFWNYYTRDDGMGGWSTLGTLTNMNLANGQISSVGLIVANAPGAWGSASSDPMYASYIYPFGGNATMTVTNLPVGRYDLYLYGPDTEYSLQSGSVNYGMQTNTDNAATGIPSWQQGVHYSRYGSVVVTNSAQPVVITVQPGAFGYATISGLQIAGIATNSGAYGAFDEYETFNYSMSSEQISNDYAGVLATAADSDGDGLSDILEMKLGYDPAVPNTGGSPMPDGDKDFDGDQLSNKGEVYKYQTDPANAFSLSPLVNDSMMLFVGLQQSGVTPLHFVATDPDFAGPQIGGYIDQGAVPGASYDVYVRVGFSGPWMPIYFGSPGQTNFIFPQSFTQGVFIQLRVGKAADSDSDGLPDAYEAMVSGTILDGTNSDGNSGTDTLPDGWEVQWWLDPKSGASPNGDSGNPDGDTPDNSAEFTAGTDPLRNSSSASPRQIVSISSAAADGGDSVATEPGSTTDLGKFVIKRNSSVGALTVYYYLGGTATCIGSGVDYSLSPAPVGPYPYSIAFANGESSKIITVTPSADALVEGTEQIIMSLATNAVAASSSAAYVVDVFKSKATVAIRERYSHTYTTTTDFNLGVLSGVTSATVAHELQLEAAMHPQFPFLHVACASGPPQGSGSEGRDTIVRINTDTGEIIGEYLTTVEDRRPGTSPSRTTVDQYGNVWIANRDSAGSPTITDFGSIVRIGMIVGGTRGTKNVDGSFTDDPVPLPGGQSPGQYLRPPFTYSTCLDRDGDGFIKTSFGLGNVLPWSNNRGSQIGVDTLGGVSSAEDEVIQEYVRVNGLGTRSIAVDKFNDIWVGGTGPSGAGSTKQQKVNGLTSQIIPESIFDPGCGGYGAVIDSQGRLWSAQSSQTLRLTPPTILPPLSTDFACLPMVAPVNSTYGIAVDPSPVDPLAGHGVGNFIWMTDAGGVVFKRWPDGTFFETSPGSGIPAVFPHGATLSQGLTVDDNGRVWVSSQRASGNKTIGQILAADGSHVGNMHLRIQVGATTVEGSGPTGVSVDSKGRIWSVQEDSNNTMRITPANIRSWSAIASSADGTKLVAAVNGGQIYTSIDNGANWTVRDRVRAWSAVASSADGVNLIAVANGGQIFTSIDSGVTWTARETTRNWSAVASSSDGVKLVAVVAGGQIFTSANSGSTWTSRDSSRAWSSVASSSDGVKLVAVVNGGQVFTSTDSGSTWTSRDSSRAWSSVASSSDGVKLAAVVNGGQIFTSANSGSTWTAREKIRNWSAVASSSGGDKLVAVATGGRTYTSGDSGVTWTASESIRFWSGVASSSSGDKLAALVNGGRIYTSANSGVNWSVREINLSWSAIASSANGLKLVAVVNGGAGEIHTSTDGGVSWTPRENSRAWSSVASSADGVKLVAVVNGGQIFTSADSGSTWTPRDSSRAWSSVASSSDGVKLVAVVNGGQIFTSVNSGSTWTPRDSVRNWSSVASSSDGVKLVAVVNGGQIFTSVNSGASWTSRDSSRNWSAVASSSDGQKLIAVVNSGRLFTSDDVGATWTERTVISNTDRAWSAVACSSDASTLIAAVNGEGVFKSSIFSPDNWTRIADSGMVANNVPNVSNRAWKGVTCSSDGQLMVGIVAGGEIYTSDDSGTTWFVRGGGPADVNMAVDLGDDTHPSGIAAKPYNYSDMTGFNNHIVNPGGCPLKGYWMVIHDAGSRIVWESVTWTKDVTAGGSIQVFVRASDDRLQLSTLPFTAVPDPSGILPTGQIKGQFLEVRVGFIRSDCDGNPILRDLTVNGTSSGIQLVSPIQDANITEGQDHLFEVSVLGGGSLTYEWKKDGEVIKTGADPFLLLSSVDCLDEGFYTVTITEDASGESMDGGVAFLAVAGATIQMPGSGSSGPASRYPAQIVISGIPVSAATTVSRIRITLSGLTHNHPNDLDIVLVSPYGAKVMLMSDAGNNTLVDNAVIIFDSDSSTAPPGEGQGALVPTANSTVTFMASNSGTSPQETSLPGGPSGGPFSTLLSDFTGATDVKNPNGVWQLYIYDDTTGGLGNIQGSWCLDLIVP